VDYLCANFSLPRPLLSSGDNVRDRQTDGGGGIITVVGALCQGECLPYCLNHEIWSVDSQENYCHQMSDFKAKCTKFDFGWGSAPDPAGRAYSAPPDP